MPRRKNKTSSTEERDREPAKPESLDRPMGRGGRKSNKKKLNQDISPKDAGDDEISGHQLPDLPSLEELQRSQLNLHPKIILKQISRTRRGSRSRSSAEDEVTTTASPSDQLIDTVTQSVQSASLNNSTNEAGEKKSASLVDVKKSGNTVTSRKSGTNHVTASKSVSLVTKSKPGKEDSVKEYDMSSSEDKEEDDPKGTDDDEDEKGSDDDVKEDHKGLDDRSSEDELLQSSEDEQLEDNNAVSEGRKTPEKDPTNQLMDAILISPRTMKTQDRERNITVNFVSPSTDPILEIEDEFLKSSPPHAAINGFADVESMEVDLDPLEDNLLKEEDRPEDITLKEDEAQSMEDNLLKEERIEDEDSVSKESSLESGSALSSLRSSPVAGITSLEISTVKDVQTKRSRLIKEKRRKVENNKTRKKKFENSNDDLSNASNPHSRSMEHTDSLDYAEQSNTEFLSSARLKSRRTSKLSDSEDSVVSTDSPLKPGSYLRRYGGVSHGDKGLSVTGDNGAGGGHRTHDKIHRMERIEKPSMEADSPREEQPLYPTSYLIQKKRMESERGLDKQEVTPAKEEEEEVLKQEKKEEEKVIISEEERLRQAEEDRKEVEKRLRSFKHITENLYLCARKINKQFRKMQCDCDIVRDDEGIVENGCMDDCANRMLMIECGKDCPLDTKCGNKRFQNKENATVEVFKTPWKGFGVRATNFIPKDTFIMEYVGEALDHKQFRRRAKQYARNNVEHFYFMALSKDCYVDATHKGNISRFINHSCDPNSMTQKWMVNGENRVGFFTKRDVHPGEELNFDYKYERYGQAAQKCYCGTSICRGWLGREPTSDSGIDEAEEWTTSEEEGEEDERFYQEKKGHIDLKEERKRTEKKLKREKRRKREEERNRWREEEEWEEEIERLSNSGVKNRIHTVLLCRLMVRASQVESRQRLAQLLTDSDKPCRRLFLDYQGLRILSQWMQDLEWSLPELDFKLMIQNLLADLPIPHRTMLKDSKVWSTMQLWSLATPDDPTPSLSPGKSSNSKQSRKTSPKSSSSKAAPQSSSSNSTSNDPTPPSGSGSSNHTPTSSGVSTPTTKPSDKMPSDYSSYIEEELYPPGEEPTDAADTPCDTDEEIQVVQEFEGDSSSRPQSRQASRPSSRNSDKMKLKVVSLDEVEEDVRKSGMQDVVCLEDEGRTVASTLSAQAEVKTGINEGGLDAIVLPIHREDLPLTEEEEERALILAQVLKVQLKAKELLEVWSLLQEVFKIPKRERHKMRVEHEREADRHYSSQDRHNSSHDRHYPSQDRHYHPNDRHYTPVDRHYPPVDRHYPPVDRHYPVPDRRFPSQERSAYSSTDYSSEDSYTNLQMASRNYAESRLNDLNRTANQTPERGDRGADSGRSGGGGSAGGAAGTRGRYQTSIYDKTKQGSIVVPRERRNLRLDDCTGSLHSYGLSREARRTLFEEKIKEEKRQKELRAALLSRHTQCCRLLGLKADVTPLFDAYPEYYLSGGDWVQMPPPPEPIDPNWRAPNMAWLPEEAYRATDPKAPNPRDIYPPGVCPPPPPPKPRVITVPGRTSSEAEVVAYYEEMYKRKPRSPDQSPPPPREHSPRPGKKVIPPYPGYLVQAPPDTIFFDPESLRPPPPTETPESASRTSSAFSSPCLRSVSDRLSGGSGAKSSAAAADFHHQRSSDRHSAAAGSSGRKSSTDHRRRSADRSSSSGSRSTEKRRRRDKSPHNGSESKSTEQRRSSSHQSSNGARRSLESDLSYGEQPVVVTLSPDGRRDLSPDNRFESPAEILDSIMSSPANPVENSISSKSSTPDLYAGLSKSPLVPDHLTDTSKSPDPSLPRSPDNPAFPFKSSDNPDPAAKSPPASSGISPSPDLPAKFSQQPEYPRNSSQTPPSVAASSSRRRLPPKTVDFLNSSPHHEVVLSGGREVPDPECGELELCDTPVLVQQGEHGTPLASLVRSADQQQREWRSDEVEACGVVQANGENSTSLVVRLPRSWKVARDGEGRVYYYHVATRVSQWEPPTPEQLSRDEQAVYPRREEECEREEVEMETNSSDEDDDDSDDDEEGEEEKDGVEEEETMESIEEGELTQDQDLSASEKKMLLRMRYRGRESREERSNRRKAKRRQERQRREQEREINEARSQRHRDNGLVSQHYVPRDRNNSAAKEIRERLLHKEEVLKEIDKEIREDEMQERQEQEKLRREQKKAEKSKREVDPPLPDVNVPSSAVPLLRQTKSSSAAGTPSKTSTTTAAADTSSSEGERRGRERFIKEMSQVIVKALDPFRNPKSRGYIKNNEDFKHLAKKLTNTIYEKERMRVRSVDELKITDKMKVKATEYVKKKMNTYDKEYKRSPQK